MDLHSSNTMEHTGEGSAGNKESLANQPVNKLFWRYTIPAVAGMLVNGLYATIDGIFIGQVVGAEGLAAMNLCWPVFGIIIGIGMMIGMGSSAHSSIARGQGDLRRARTILGNGVVLMLLAGLLQTLALLYIGDPVLQLMGATGSVFDMGSDYLFYISLAATMATAGAGLPMMVRNDERPQLATLIISTGAVLNIILDYLFIIVWEQGIAGAALATIFAQSVTAIWSLAYFFSPKAKLRLKLQDLGMELKDSWNILATGLPSLTMFAYMSFVLAVHNKLFLIHGSVTTLAAFTIVGYIQAVYYMTAEGIANGIQPIVSFNKGANNNKNIRAAIRMGSTAALGLGIGTVLFINLFPQTIASIFNRDNVQLMSETVLGLRLHLMTMFLDGFIVVAAAYFQSLAKSRTATFITVGNMVVQIPLLLTLPPLFGAIGVWLSMPISNVFLAAAVLWLLLKDLKERPTVAT